MEVIDFLLNFFLHIDRYLDEIINNFGVFSYLILFLIIFAETGLVVTPFLPGDSLLFAAGAFAARGSFSAILLFFLLTIAAILGDTINYWIGHFIGPKAFRSDNSKFFKKKYLDKTKQFYDKHGGKTIVLARFIPIVRTFAPFVAGVAKMNYFHFLFYNIFGGVLWVGLFVFAGYWFGDLEVVKKNFSLVILAIIFVSLLPGIIELIKHRLNTQEASIRK